MTEGLTLSHSITKTLKLRIRKSVFLNINTFNILCTVIGRMKEAHWLPEG